jgi:hypothetical protein
MKKLLCGFAVAGLVLAACILAIDVKQASAEVIFSDDFNRNGPLHDSSVSYADPTLYPGGLTWVSTGSGHNNTTTANGGQEVGGWNARLSFAPLAGEQYLLSFTVGPTLQNALEVGFAQDSGSFGSYNWLNQDVLDMLTAKIGQINDFGHTVSGIRTQAGTYTLDSNTGPGYATPVSLLLDTTSGLSSASLTWKVNDVTKGTWSGDVSTYNSVVFGRGDGPNDPNGTQISNFMLTKVIPEPASGLLLISGIAGLLLIHRRR